MSSYQDLLITNDDITLDVGGNPVYIEGKGSIAQDLMHMIREKGLLVALIGNRDAVTRKANIVKLILEVENDYRIVAGSVVVDEPKLGEFWLTATTIQYGTINLRLEANNE